MPAAVQVELVNSAISAGGEGGLLACRARRGLVRVVTRLSLLLLLRRADDWAIAKLNLVAESLFMHYQTAVEVRHTPPFRRCVPQRVTVACLCGGRATSIAPLTGIVLRARAVL